MASDPFIQLASLRFSGSRFSAGAFDVECAAELPAYRQLLLACAKELWREANPARSRLPKNFDDLLVVTFSRVEAGSAIVPLMRAGTLDAQLSLIEGDLFDTAASMIDAVILAANGDEKLPAPFPRSVVPFFRPFGATLRADETIYIRSRLSESDAPYTPLARQRLVDWIEATYEDNVDLLGEVSMANVRGGAFAITVDSDKPPIAGKFDEVQEALVLEALREHRSARLQIRGVGEFSTLDHTLQRIISVEEANVRTSDGHAPLVVSENLRPIWQRLAELGQSADEAVWKEVPSDLSLRLDHYLHGIDD